MGAIGTGTAGAVVVGTAGVATAVAAEPSPPPSDRYGRLFRLPPFAEASPQVNAALQAMGEAGGLLDARDPLEHGPAALVLDPALSANNPDNPTQTAGTTFMGQFLDHDVTFDTTSRLGRTTAPEATTNARTPGFDLDSVYGGGPVSSLHLYDPADRAKLLVESGGTFEDVPRTADNRAILGDPRNDEHVIIAGMQAAFMKFHNRVVDHVRAGGAFADTLAAFAEARRLVTRHYHWMILHEFLPQFVGPALASDILANGRRFYNPARGEAFIPVEFQGAAYRFGHSMVRPSYRANLAGDGGQPFFAFVFDPSQEGSPDPADLRGGARAPRRFVGWQTFFDFGDGQVRPNKLIDTKISTPLFNLPLGAIASGDRPTSLAQRNLLRQVTWSLPSGQEIARAMGVAPLAPSELSELRGFHPSFDHSTPLWYYILKEAELRAGGRHLGPVGGRIVGEVFVGLIDSDPNSYRAVEPGWRPVLPGRTAGQFTMVDLLTFAGVDPASRGQ